jgi:hypothetical protein
MTKVFFIFTLVFFHLVASIQAQSTLSLEIKSSRPETAQVYYDDGSGFSEANSAKATLNGNGDFELIEFMIPVGNLKALRFDPLEESGSIELRSVKLKSGDKQIQIPLDQVTPANQIAKTEIQEGVLLIDTTPGAFDPQLVFSIRSLMSAAQPHVKLLSNQLIACTALGLIVLCIFVFFQLIKISLDFNTKEAIDFVLKNDVLILAGVFFSILASKLFLISKFGSDIPFWDQWIGEGQRLLLLYQEGCLAWGDLLAPHNEHRIMLPRLFVLGLFLLNGQWDPMVSMVAQAALHAGVLTLFVSVCRSFITQRAWIGFALITVFIYLVPFSWENTLWGFQSVFYFSILCGFVGIWLTWRFSPFSKGWLAGWGFFVIGLFTLGSAFLAVAAAAGVAFLRLLAEPSQRLRWAAGFGALALVVMGALSIHVNFPGHEPLKAHSIGEFFRFLFFLAAWPQQNAIFSLLMYLPIFSIGIFVLLHRPSREDPLWFLATLGCWCFLGLAGLAYGRANSGMSSRYTDNLAFAILVSLACALWFCGHPCKKLRVAAKGLFILQVVSITAGLLYFTSSGLIEEIASKKALEPIQKEYLLTFLKTDDPQVLVGKPFLHVPYPDALSLAQMLREEKLREVLPSAVHPELAPWATSFNENAFVKNGGVWHTTKPANLRLHFGSYTNLGNLSTGEMRLDFPATSAVAAFQMLVAGYPLNEGMNLVLETPDGKRKPISVRENPKETWHEVIFANPGTPFSILAVDSSPNFWLAFSLPVPIGRLSIWTKWLLANWWIFGTFGAVSFASSFLLAGSWSHLSSSTKRIP